MERIRTNIQRLKRSNPFLSSLMLFNMSMKEGNYSMKEITDGFDSLVEKGDYPRKHRDELLEQAINLSKTQ